MRAGPGPLLCLGPSLLVLRQHPRPPAADAEVSLRFAKELFTLGWGRREASLVYLQGNLMHFGNVQALYNV